VWSERGPLRYERLTWPEVRRAAAEDRVALVPVATLEDHGRHLPVDTDLRIVAEICERAAAAFYLASPKAAASSNGSATPPGAAWPTPASWRPRSTWRSTRTRSTWTWR
jgi:hypothetical protein